jgi:LCP family protein required for cell wall assembly
MTAAERKTLFAALAELIKNPPKEEDDPDALDKLKEHLENMAQNPVKHTDDIYNVLLVGTDERGEDPTYARNSDTMILATINYKDGTITLTSLLRDTYVEYEYYTSKGELRKNQSKLNSAVAVGGIKTLISAIEKNYGVKIDNYVRVNWTSFVDVFEVLGGVDVSVNAKHLEKLNKTILDTCSFFDVDYESKKLAEGGYQHLDPYQTLAYVRYRVDDADFGRTARQREVLTILFNEVNKSSSTKMNELLNTVLPMLTTDLTQGYCASLRLDFPSIIGYKLQQTRVPEWGEYTNTASGDLSINWKKALKRLFQTAYGSLCPEQYK